MQSYADSLYGLIWFGITRYAEIGDGRFRAEVFSTNPGEGENIISALNSCLEP
ncbi:MAG: hypothetical protein AAF568_00425 [Pseudomonadota bacterium]